jgi:hypothetical protein
MMSPFSTQRYNINQYPACSKILHKQVIAHEFGKNLINQDDLLTRNMKKLKYYFPQRMNINPKTGFLFGVLLILLAFLIEIVDAATQFQLY